MWGHTHIWWGVCVLTHTSSDVCVCRNRSLIRAWLLWRKHADTKTHSSVSFLKWNQLHTYVNAHTCTLLGTSEGICTRDNYKSVWSGTTHTHRWCLLLHCSSVSARALMCRAVGGRRLVSSQEVTSSHLNVPTRRQQLSAPLQTTPTPQKLTRLVP